MKREEKRKQDRHEGEEIPSTFEHIYLRFRLASFGDDLYDGHPGTPFRATSAMEGRVSENYLPGGPKIDSSSRTLINGNSPCVPQGQQKA